jgi:uncharacterized GH25 family protein
MTTRIAHTSVRRTTKVGGVVCALLLVAASAAAHDLFLRARDYFLAQNSAVELLVLNGTFDESEGPVTRDRIRDISLVAPAGTTHPDTGAWHPRGDTTYLRFRTAESGTYVVGASVLPRVLALSADDFNQYLRSDGIADVLDARRRAGELGKAARERYSKHVKAVLQVGEKRTDQYRTLLGYPAELVPLENPYTLVAGDSLEVRALVDGSSVSGQLVLAGGRSAGGKVIAESSARTDAQGVAHVLIHSPGQWYVKFIHMVRVPADREVDYESKWATLTFEVRAR